MAPNVTLSARTVITLGDPALHSPHAEDLRAVYTAHIHTLGLPAAVAHWLNHPHLPGDSAELVYSSLNAPYQLTTTFAAEIH